MFNTDLNRVSTVLYTMCNIDPDIGYSLTERLKLYN